MSVGRRRATEDGKAVMLSAVGLCKVHGLQAGEKVWRRLKVRQRAGKVYTGRCMTLWMGEWGKCQSLVVCKGVLWSTGTVEGEDSSLACLGATKRIDVLSTCESKSVLRPRNGEALFI